MKINLFSYVFWPEQFLINEFVKDLDKSTHEIHIFTGLPNYPGGKLFSGYSVFKGPYNEDFSGAKILRYPIIERKKGFSRLMVNYLSHLTGACFNLFRLPKADWAFVFATSPITTVIPAIFWAKLSGAKVCVWLQDLWPDSVAAVGATNRKSLLYKTLGKLVSWIYRHIDLMLIQSPGFADNLSEFNYKGPYHVVPNWAPGLDFKKTSVPLWLEDIPNKFTVTFAGNVGKAQAVDTVIESARLLSQNNKIQFLIVGDGSDLARAKDIVAQNSMDNVLFFGRRPIEDMPGLFKRSDALLVSLRKDPIFARTIPSKVQAYMAAGKPLLGSLDGVGFQVLQESKAGLVVPTEDPKALAEIISQMADMSEEIRTELGNNAQSYFYENYQKDRIISQILKYLEQYK